MASCLLGPFLLAWASHSGGLRVVSLQRGSWLPRVGKKKLPGELRVTPGAVSPALCGLGQGGRRAHADLRR